jgi:thymidylate synthase ThyX
MRQEISTVGQHESATLELENLARPCTRKLHRRRAEDTSFDKQSQDARLLEFRSW